MGSIRTEQRGEWRKIILDRPHRLNAFNDEMHQAAALALDEAANDVRCRAVLLTGEGRAFCAGQDLNDRVSGEGGAEPDLGDTVERFYNPLIRRLRSLPKPVVCAVNGVAAGAGANITLACDIVLAARSARFVQAFAKIGLIPDSGGTFFLPRLVGEARARALIMTAEPLDAETAAAWGLIWKAVDDEALLPEAEALTEHLATQPTQGLALAKRALAASAANTLDAQLDLERDLQRLAGQTPDYREGVQAFLAKRQPRFTGQPRRPDAAGGTVASNHQN
jgi:2-(1,2-epoxy-1,2-dihydrophenyl)acetyl-CoA isomerase